MARRIVTAQEQHEMLSPWRTAMPGESPFGLTLHYHPTDDTLPADVMVNKQWSNDRKGRPLNAPAVVARVNGRYVGHLEWKTPDPDDEYSHPHPVVDEVYVQTRHRRKGLATQLFDFAKSHEPKLEHSSELSPLGEKWVAYETGETEGRDGYRPDDAVAHASEYRKRDPGQTKTWWNSHENTYTSGLLPWPDDLRHHVDGSADFDSHPGLSLDELGELNKHVPYQAGHAAARHPVFADHPDPHEAFKSFWHWDDGRGAGAIGGVAGVGHEMGQGFYQGWQDARKGRHAARLHHTDRESQGKPGGYV